MRTQIFGCLHKVQSRAMAMPTGDGQHDFVRLYLPIFEVMLKAGLGGLIFYVFVLISCLRLGYTFPFIATILMLIVFYITKGMLFHTVHMVRLAKIEGAYAIAIFVNPDLPVKGTLDVIPLPS